MTGTRLRARPVAFLSAATTAGVAAIVASSPIALHAVGRAGLGVLDELRSTTGGTSRMVGIR